MDTSVKGFVIFLLGGPGGTFGPILAAFLLELASTFAWSHLLTFHLGMMGIIIMLTVLYLPRGFSEFLRGCAATFRWPSSVGARSRKA